MPNLIFDLPKNQSSIIKVLGIGGGGSNAVTHMFKQGIKDVDFVICNTDAQALERSSVPNKIQLGLRGLGAGNIPEVGKLATLENIDKLKELLEVNTQMLFITAGMGGGTGTGGAPVIAQAARELNILTVGIVTMPFSFEGRKRRQQAEDGIAEMRKYVDTLLVINNDKLRELYGNLKLSEAFGMADDILSAASRGIAEIITVPGYVNVDFEDVKTVMKDSGKAILGSGIAEGPDRASNAVKQALSSPLLDDNHIMGARNVLLYITSGKEEISMDEVSEITDYIQQEAGQKAEIIWGNGSDETLGNKICVTCIATGFDSKRMDGDRPDKIIVGSLSDEPIKNTAIIPPLTTILQPEAIEDPKKEMAGPKITASAPETTEAKETPNPVEIPFIKPVTGQPVLDNTSNDTRIFSEPLLPEIPEIKLADRTPSPSPAEKDQLIEQLNNDRKQRLRALSLKYKQPGGLAELEKEPAYIRRQVELHDPPQANGTQISRFTLVTDENDNIDLRANNSFLHDNVD